MEHTSTFRSIVAYRMPRPFTLNVVNPQIKCQSVSTTGIKIVRGRDDLISDSGETSTSIHGRSVSASNHGITSESDVSQDSSLPTSQEKDLSRKQCAKSVQSKSVASNIYATEGRDPDTLDALHGLLLLTSDRSTPIDTVPQGADHVISSVITDQNVNVAEIVVQSNKMAPQKRGLKSSGPEKRSLISPRPGIVKPARDAMAVSDKSRKLKVPSKPNKLVDAVVPLRRSPRKSASTSSVQSVPPEKGSPPKYTAVNNLTALDVADSYSSESFAKKSSVSGSDLQRDNLPAMTSSNTNLSDDVEEEEVVHLHLSVSTDDEDAHDAVIVSESCEPSQSIAAARNRPIAGTNDYMNDSFEDEISPPCYEDISEDEPCFVNNSTQTNLPNSPLVTCGEEVSFKPVGSPCKRGVVGSSDVTNDIETAEPVLQCNSSSYSTSPRQRCNSLIKDETYVSRSYDSSSFNAVECPEEKEQRAVIVQFLPSVDQDQSYVRYTSDLDEYGNDVGFERNNGSDDVSYDNDGDNATPSKRMKVSNEEKLNNDDLKNGKKRILIRDCSVVLTNVQLITNMVFGINEKKRSVAEISIIEKVVKEREKPNYKSANSKTIMHRKARETVKDNFSSMPPQSEKELTVPDCVSFKVRKSKSEGTLNVPHTISPEASQSRKVESVKKTVASPTRKSDRHDVRGSNLRSIDTQVRSKDIQVRSEVSAPKVKSSYAVSVNDEHLQRGKTQYKTSVSINIIQSLNQRVKIFSARKTVRTLNKKDIVIGHVKKLHTKHPEKNNLRKNVKQPDKNESTKSDTAASEESAPASQQSVQYQLARCESPIRRNCLAVAAIRNADLLNPKQLVRSVFRSTKAWRKNIPARKNNKSPSVKMFKKNDDEVRKAKNLNVLKDTWASGSEATDKNRTTLSVQLDRIEEIANSPCQLILEDIISSNGQRSPGKVNSRDASLKTFDKLSVAVEKVESPSGRSVQQRIENDTHGLDREPSRGKEGKVDKEVLSTVASMEAKLANTGLSGVVVGKIVSTSNEIPSRNETMTRDAGMRKSIRVDAARKIVRSLSETTIIYEVVGNNAQNFKQIIDDKPDRNKSSVAVLSIDQGGSVIENRSVGTEGEIVVKKRGRPPRAKTTAEELQNHSEKNIGEFKNRSETVIWKVQNQPERFIEDDAELEKQSEKNVEERQAQRFQRNVSPVAKAGTNSTVSTLLNDSQKKDKLPSLPVVPDTVGCNSRSSESSDAKQNVNSRKENNKTLRLKDKVSSIAEASTVSDVSTESRSVEDNKLKKNSKIVEQNKSTQAVTRSKSDTEIVSIAKSGSKVNSLPRLQGRDKSVQGFDSTIKKRSLGKAKAPIDRSSVETEENEEPLTKRSRVETTEKSNSPKKITTKSALGIKDHSSIAMVNNDVSKSSSSSNLSSQTTNSHVSKTLASKSINEQPKVVNETGGKTNSGNQPDKRKTKNTEVSSPNRNAVPNNIKSVEKKTNTDEDVSDGDTVHETNEAGNEIISTPASVPVTEVAAAKPIEKTKARLRGAIKLPFKGPRSKPTKPVKSPRHQYSRFLSPASATTTPGQVNRANTKNLVVPNNSTTSGSNISNDVTDLTLLEDVNTSQDVQLQSIIVDIPQGHGTRISLISKTLKNENGAGRTRRRYQCVFCTFTSTELIDVTDHLIDAHQELLFCIVNRPRSTTANMLQPIFTFCRHCSFVAVEMLPMWIHFDMFHGVSGILGPLEDEDIVPPREAPASKNAARLPLMSLDSVACTRTAVYVCVDCSLWSANKSMITSHIIESHQNSFATSNGFFVKLFELRKGAPGTGVPPTYRQLYSDAAYGSNRAECFICITCLFVVYDSRLALEHYIIAHQPKKLMLACKKRGCTRVLYSETALNQHTEADHAEGGTFQMSRLASVTILESKSSREVKIVMNRGARSV